MNSALAQLRLLPRRPAFKLSTCVSISPSDVGMLSAAFTHQLFAEHLLQARANSPYLRIPLRPERRPLHATIDSHYRVHLSHTSLL